MRMDIVSIAKELSQQPNNTELHLRFISDLQSVSSLEELKKILAIDYPLLGGLVLERIRDILPKEQSGIYLSLAFWKYFNGMDDEAIQCWERAKMLNPTDRDVLRANIWLNYNLGSESIAEACNDLLALHPDDKWGVSIKRQLESGKPITEMTQPVLSNSWEIAEF